MIKCTEPHHPDCRMFAGPFHVVNVNTGQRMRPNGFHSLAGAFHWAENAVARSDNAIDYLVQNRRMETMRRPTHA